MLKIMGYTDCSKNKLMITECLETLQELGLIQISEDWQYRKGHHGRYYELYRVNTKSNVQVKLEQKMKGDSDFIEEKNAPLLEDIKELEPSDTQMIALDNSGKEIYIALDNVVSRLKDMPRHTKAYKMMVENVNWAVERQKNQLFFDNHKEEIYKYMPNMDEE